MKVTIAAILTMAATLSAYGRVGDWTNFLYITCYGTSTYWLAQDTFAGGSGIDSFNHPQGVLADANAVYVIDTGNDRIVKLGYEKMTILMPEPSNYWQMFYVTNWGTRGSASNQFNVPTDASFGPNGELFIVDCSNHCIKITDTQGTFLGSFGSLGSGSNQFRRPTGICTVTITNATTIVTKSVTNSVVTVSFRTLVADYGNDRVVEYMVGTSGWQFVRQITNIINYPYANYNLILKPYDVVVIDTNVYITETGYGNYPSAGSPRVKAGGGSQSTRFILLNYSNGAYIADWNEPETAPGVPWGGFTAGLIQGVRGLINFDGFLLCATAASGQNQYLIADSLGYFMGKFGTAVLGGSVTASAVEGEFGYPYNLAKIGNFVFCADSGNNRVQMWKSNSQPYFDYPKTNYFKVRELQVLSFTVHAKDDDGDALDYSGTLTPNLPAPTANWVKNWGINSEYMKFSMIPRRGAAANPTLYAITLTASDGIGSASMDVTIEVQPINPKHKKLLKLPKAGMLDPCFEDWVYPEPGTGNLIDDGDLVSLKLGKTAVLNQWDGSVLDVDGSSSINLTAKRAKTLVGTGYDTVYGEFNLSTNEYARRAVAQLDVIRSTNALKSIVVLGSLGRVAVSNALLGKVSVKSGSMGGAEATLIKSIAVSLGKIKDVITTRISMIGGDISGQLYPGGYGKIYATDWDPKKFASMGSVMIKGGDLVDTWIQAKGHVSKVSVAMGKDEFKLPVGGVISNALIRAGYDVKNQVNTQVGTIAGVQASLSIEKSQIIGAADAGGKFGVPWSFSGTADDAGEKYYGSVKKITYGKTGHLAETLVVSSNAIKKLIYQPSCRVIFNGAVQP